MRSLGDPHCVWVGASILPEAQDGGVLSGYQLGMGDSEMGEGKGVVVTGPGRTRQGYSCPKFSSWFRILSPGLEHDTASAWALSSSQGMPGVGC
jgi:hypothetical protein